MSGLEILLAIELTYLAYEVIALEIAILAYKLFSD